MQSSEVVLDLISFRLLCNCLSICRPTLRRSKNTGEHLFVPSVTIALLASICVEFHYLHVYAMVCY